jgi:predicted kinase
VDTSWTAAPASRLIFVEGLPGSGKSTTARVLVDRLREAGLAAELIAEVQAGHPLNVGGELHPAGRTTGEELFQRYTVEAYIAESLQRWRAFVEASETRPVVHVVDSYPYQNAARVLLQLDSPTPTILAYASEVEAIVRPLAPRLIYLRGSPGAQAMAALSAARGAEWSAYVVAVATNGPYAVHHQLVGLEGALAVLDAYDALLHDLLGASSLPRLELEHCGQDWPGCHERMAAFLGI